MVFVVVIHLFIYLFGFIFWMAGWFGDLQKKSSGFDTGKFLSLFYNEHSFVTT